MIAKRAEVKHALALGAVAVALAIVSMILFWGLQPVWYQVTLIVIVGPAVWLGGWLRGRRPNRVQG